VIILRFLKFLINQDSNPQVIIKKVKQQLDYVQELAVRYLKPPTPPAPGEIVRTRISRYIN